MFTGLIKTFGNVRRIDQRGDRIITIAMQESFPVEVGDSIACQGICLTAIKVTDNEFKISLSEETLRCSTADDWHTGTVLNLEPALRVGDALGGHFVSGHVDGVAKAIRAEKVGDSVLWEFEVPPALSKFIAPKGSITVDGVSLTVNTAGGVSLSRAEEGSAVPITDLFKPTFTVNIIPHTAKMTTFGTLQVGDAVNIEVDMLARYVAQLKE